jgi:diguanylate cyclase (GGDEF)-like protein|nr:EAL domain-containing protein [Neorhizobium tomejilense]
MLSILSCLPSGHNPLYVFSALVVCAVGSALTASLYQKCREASAKRRKTALVLLGGMTAGSTVWTTHFLSMLGVDMPFAYSYGIEGTILSLVLAVSLSCAAFYLGSSDKGTVPVLLGGFVLSAGIVGMHHIGIAALTFEGQRNHDATRVVVSALLSLVFSVLALLWPILGNGRLPRVGTAIAFVLAVGTLHYVAMSGLTLEPGPGGAVADDSVRQVLFIGVLFMTVLIMAFGTAATILDTQSVKDYALDMERRAYHDHLTGLPNRFRLDEALADAIAKRRTNERLALVSFDFNRFKAINDVHGHHAGDAVLRGVSSRLSAALREGEIVCRVGGDEFVALKRGFREAHEAEDFAARLRSAVVADIHWGGKSLDVGSSLGVSMYPDDGGDAADLLVKADLAMYRAKRDRLEVPLFYDAQLDEENRNLSALAIDLRKAVEKREFELVYQRQNDVMTNEVVGYEVLIRWHHPEHGYVPPSVFVPLAEKDGMIAEIGEWVLRTACREAATWARPMKIAVNVAARQLSNDALPGIVRSALDESGLDSRYLEIEITESGIVADVEQARKIVHELKDIGVSIAMDDFGTGYSSLSTLQSFPFDKIKIDRAFVRNLTTSTQSQAIVKSTISLGRALKIDVLAEGVETTDDLDFLKREGCYQAQGFLFGKPLPSKHIVS